MIGNWSSLANMGLSKRIVGMPDIHRWSPSGTRTGALFLVKDIKERKMCCDE
jgi:hypothetical protein